MLKLYRNCPLMLTENSCVRQALANGTMAIFIKLVLNEGSTMFRTVIDGVECNGVFASDVKHVLLKHGEKLHFKTFTLEPKRASFKARFPKPPQFCAPRSTTQWINLSGIQLPIISNDATTGHKLQGCSLEELFVSAWNYSKNWPYVVISRVKTRRGLFLKTKMAVSRSMSIQGKDYSPDHRLIRMLKDFEETRQPAEYIYVPHAS